jgi:hypothetical protein
MARTRNIKPSFFTNDRLAECQPLARLLFAGLWTVADREGRLEDRPKKIKAEILPYDECDVDELLNALTSKGFIIRYFNGENNYIQILKFIKHQTPHLKEAASTIPAPDLSSASTGNSGTSPPLTLNPSSLTLNPESGADTGPVDATVEFEFEEFFAAYPGLNKGKVSDAQKGTKETARREYRTARRRGAEHAKLMAGAKAYEKFLRLTDGIAKHADKWLPEKGWETNYAVKTDKGGTREGGYSGM